MQQDIDNFIHELRYERQLSPHTLVSYRRDLDGFFAYQNKHGISNWRDIDDKKVREFVATRFRNGIAGRSLQRALSAIRMFYEYLIIHRQATQNPAKQVKAPKTIQKLPAHIDVDLTQRLLDIDDDDGLSIRDKAMFELFYSSGLRLTELVSTNLNDIDLVEGFITVIGKGNKTRQIPVGRYAIIAIKQWLTVRDEFMREATEALFLNRQGKRISQRSIQLRLKQWAHKQGIDMHVHPHMLRHTFATHMLEGCGDIRAVQELLGHADLSSTQIYTHIDFQQLASVYDKAHPRARKKSG